MINSVRARQRAGFGMRHLPLPVPGPQRTCRISDPRKQLALCDNLTRILTVGQFGLMTQIKLPGGEELVIYQPKHPSPLRT